jgi:TonB family protein
VRKLDLSDAQITKIEDTFLQHRGKLSGLRDALEREEKQLAPLLEAQNLETMRVNAQLERVLTARNELERENTRMLLAFRSVLNIEQWKELQAMQERQEPPPPPPPSAPPPPPPPPPPPMPPNASQDEDRRVYKIGDGVKAPLVLAQPLPPYTQEARDAKIEGLVLLQATILKDGKIKDTKVIRGLGYGLDESAVQTISTRWSFKPGTLNGKAVNVRVNIEVSFRLYK